MKLTEDKVFLHDPRPNMMTEEKNLFLSAQLATAPNRSLNIVRIDRVEIGSTGWWITHRIFIP